MTGKWQNNVKTKCLWQISFSCNFMMFLSLSCQFSLISLMFSWLYCVCVVMFQCFSLLFLCFSFVFFTSSFFHWFLPFFLAVHYCFVGFFPSIPLVSRFFHWFSLLFHCFSLIVQWFCWSHARNDWKYKENDKNDRTMSKPNVCGKYHFPVILSCFCHFPVSFHWFP